jgi:hypothetical protein
VSHDLYLKDFDQVNDGTIPVMDKDGSGRRVKGGLQISIYFNVSWYAEMNENFLASQLKFFTIPAEIIAHCSCLVFECIR